MEIKLIAETFSDEQIEFLVRETFMATVDDPVVCSAVERGFSIPKFSFGGVHVLVSLDVEDTAMDVKLIEHDEENAEVILPHRRHWGKLNSMLSEPEWFRHALSKCCCVDDFEFVDAVKHCHFTLDQISILTGREVSELASSISGCEPLAGDGILGEPFVGNIKKPSDDPAEWAVDIRAFALWVLANE